MHNLSTTIKKLTFGASSLLTACTAQPVPAAVCCRDWTADQKAAIYERARTDGPQSMPTDDPMRWVDKDYIRVCRQLQC